MHQLAALSLANRALIALVTAAIAFFGVISMNSLKQELIPSVTLPVVTVVTSYPGASPQVVDKDVSRPVEAVMQGLEGLEATTTTSSANLSVVQVEFRYGTDLVYAQQRMQVALNRMQQQLPEAATTNILTGSIDDFPVMQIAVVGGERDAVANLIRLETLGDLVELDGVRDATLSGAASPRIAINPNEQQMATFGVTQQTIRDTLDISGALIPIGELTEGDETLTVQAGALLSSADDIAALPLQGVTNNGAPLTIGEVATVVQDTEPLASISRVNGEDALTISVTKRPDANTVAVSQAVTAALPGIQAKLGDGVELVTVFDQAPFVEQSIETLVVEGLLGLLFAVIVIFVFLLSFRATIVTAISIPTSLLVTFIGLQAADYSLNILTLGALTIAIGRVVDDSIVVIENINRHMANRPSASRRGPERAAVIIEAVREVGGAITASTISTVAVFLPIAFVSDISGELFRPFALTSVIALLASLVVSLTIVPVLAYWTLGGARARGAQRGAEARRRVGPEAAIATVDARRQAASESVHEPALVGAAALPAQGAPPASRRDHKAASRAEADRAVFSPLELRDDAAALSDSVAAASAASTEPAPVEAPEQAPARSHRATDAVPEAPPLTADDLPRDPLTGEVTLSRRALRELREQHGDEAVDDAVEAARADEHGDAAHAAEPPEVRQQPEQQHRGRDAEPAAAPAPGEAAPRDAELHEERTSWLQRAYEPVLRWTLARPAVTLLAALLVLIATGLLAPLMKTNFLGDAGGNTFTVAQTLAPNASLDTRDEAASRVEQVLLATEGIETVQLTITGTGGSMFAGFGGGSAPRATFSVITSEGADVTDVQERVRAELESTADVGEISVSQGGRGGGFSSDLAVEVSAPTTGALREAAQQITDALRGTEGMVEVSNSLEATRPFVQLDIDPATAARFGLSEFAIGGMVAQQMTPVPVGALVIEGESVRVYLVGDAPPKTLDELRNLQLITPLGPQPLSALATVEVVDGPVSIRAERGTPTATVTVVPGTENLSRSNADVQEVLDGLALPPGATATLGGVSADQQAAFEQLGLALLAAILIVYIVMVATFKSLLQPFLLLVSIPFAATGAVLLQLATGVPLGVASIIGVLMLVGIVVTNAIVLIDLVNQFRTRGFAVRDAVVHGGSRRVRPIVMTALATIFALMPMALGVTGHSGFISQPLALAVIGGLLSSTVLTLLVLPALYAVVEGPRERRRQRRAERAEAELQAAGLA